MWLQFLADNDQIFWLSAHQATAPSANELCVIEFDQMQTVRWKNISSSLIVYISLDSPRHTTDRGLLIEKWNSFGMLLFPVLDHETEIGVIGIDWKFMSSVSHEKRKPMLTERLAAEN